LTLLFKKTIGTHQKFQNLKQNLKSPFSHTENHYVGMKTSIMKYLQSFRRVTRTRLSSPRRESC
jgi:hypothetical protein